MILAGVPKNVRRLFLCGLQLLLYQCLNKASSEQTGAIPTMSKSKISPYTRVPTFSSPEIP